MTDSGLDHLLGFLDLEGAEGEFVGTGDSSFGDDLPQPQLFGGEVLAQAVLAAWRTVPEQWRIHSLHGYFLRRIDAGPPLAHTVETVRDGRSFSVRRVRTHQGDKEAFEMTCSFTVDADGDEYTTPGPGDPPGEVPGPDAARKRFTHGAWDVALLGPTPLEPDGSRRSTSRCWYRVGGPLPDDPAVHAALVALVSDWTFAGGRPLQPFGTPGGLTSLDHGLWFHREARADEWLLFDVGALVQTGGRSLVRGTIHTVDGVLVASMAQEMRVPPPAA